MIISQDFASSQVVGRFPPTLRVARVPIVPVDVYRDLLGDAEWTVACSLDSQRQLDYVAGRVAARVALHALIGPAAADATIERADDGTPHIAGLAEPPLVSISHTRHHAVAVVGHAVCIGIDLCAHADAIRVRRVVVRFVAHDETALAEGGGVAQWTALWALKEAGAKAQRRGLLDGGLRSTCLTSIDPPRFAWPALEAIVVHGADDTMAVVYKL